MPLEINRAPVLTLWAAMVAERLGHPADTALTLGLAVAGSAARVKARNIGLEERKADRDADRPGPRSDHVTAPIFLLGKTIRLLPTTDGELRAADGEEPADPGAVQRYLAKAFGDHLDEVRQAMDELANRYEPAELNRIGFRLYEKFRPDVPYGKRRLGRACLIATPPIQQLRHDRWVTGRGDSFPEGRWILASWGKGGSAHPGC